MAGRGSEEKEMKDEAIRIARVQKAILSIPDEDLDLTLLVLGERFHNLKQSKISAMLLKLYDAITLTWRKISK